jgi:hypothetical protein
VKVFPDDLQLRPERIVLEGDAVGTVELAWSPR